MLLHQSPKQFVSTNRGGIEILSQRRSLHLAPAPRKTTSQTLTRATTATAKYSAPKNPRLKWILWWM